MYPKIIPLTPLLHLLLLFVLPTLLLGQPTITGFSPTSGTVGTTVTITGTNFDAIASNNTVKFTSGITATVTAASTTSLTVTVPSGANTGTITVTVGVQTATSSSNFTLIASSRTWVGLGADQEFNTADNWLPSGVPAFTDSLKFNSSSPANCTVFFTTGGNAGQVLISGNRQVRFVANNSISGPRTLAISSLTGVDFSIAAGSSLTLDVNTTNTSIQIVFAATNTIGSISGDIIFDNTSGNGILPTHRINTTSSSGVDALTFQNGSRFYANKLSGNPFGSSGTKNTVKFANGSKYYALSGSDPFGYAQPDSKVTFSTGSTYIHQYSTLPSLVNRTYGDFEFDYAGTLSNITGSSTVGDCYINNLKITQGSFAFPLSSGNPLNLNITGDLTIADGAGLDFSPGSLAARSSIKFNGSNSQIINCNNTGILSIGVNGILEVNNFNGSNYVRINQDLSVAGILKITKGYLDLNSKNINLGSTGSLTENIASPNSYTVRDPTGSGKIIATGRTFNDASATNIAGLGISLQNGISNTVTIDISRAHNRIGGSNGNLSIRRNYNITTNSGTVSNGTMAFRYSDEEISGLGFVKADLTLWRYESGTDLWTGPFGTNSGNTITYTGVNGFSTWTASPYTAPLPLTLIDFKAKQIEKNTVQLNWSTSNEIKIKGFEIQKSSDGVQYESIQFIKSLESKENIKLYRAMDLSFANSSYYRLKIAEENNSNEYSGVIFVKQDSPIQTSNMFVYPNPVVNTISIGGLSLIENSILYIKIIDLSGKALFSERGLWQSLEVDLNKFVSTLISGLYVLEVQTEENHYSIKFLKD